MERKDYLLEGLSGKEKKYLKGIVMSARNRYIENNYIYINNKIVELNDYNVPVSESVLDIVLDKCEKEIKSAIEFHKIISNDKLRDIIEKLPLKEKMVLFSLFHEVMTVRETAEDIDVSKNTVLNRRDKSFNHIRNQMPKGDGKDV